VLWSASPPCSIVGRCEPARALSGAPQRGTLGAPDFGIP
jgi:hypothetical protein